MLVQGSGPPVGTEKSSHVSPLVDAAVTHTLPSSPVTVTVVPPSPYVSVVPTVYTASLSKPSERVWVS
ncbi:MAG: hypothetical protein HOK52_00640 [Candidatus Marinimicrobia bacterium]|nr:hypothetical protein [Candidatus Neomarinimicrobiota bacterium]MBT4635293.1 hypothetical protein [Candidatus Neomarinimicrobiota bacterium]MBT6469751.1 hypothetical protein [Candidatus Neomarinimicrobiota bacterium]